MPKELSDEELADLRETFDYYDRNKNGSIDIRELDGLMESLDVELTPDQLKVALMSLDADGSGVIEFEEFVDWWSGR
ncbi:MAG: EF-hand domain-containing protein [Alphaproteobacteria bacterium]|nr:EF-hand domain-containing protein [Alphaproteobacteria bacterium]